MQKKIIALAIAGLASTAAFAQSNVTVYGVVDAGLLNTQKTGSHSATTLASGGLAASRIGFKGVEDLGNGTKALFTLEYRLSTDSNNGIGGDKNGYSGANTTTGALTTNADSSGPARQQFVGLTGNWGTAVAGRLQTAGYDWALAYDPLAGSAFSTLQTTTQQGSGVLGLIGATAYGARADNAIAYISPKIGDVTVALNRAMLAEETSTIGGAKNGLSATMASLTYANGPLSVGGVYAKGASDGAGTGYLLNGVTPVEVNLEAVSLGASYDFGVAKLFATTQTQRAPGANDDLAKFGVQTVSLAVPVSAAGTVVASMGRKSLGQDVTATSTTTAVSANTNAASIAYTHNLSKRTTAYGGYFTSTQQNAIYDVAAANGGTAGSSADLKTSTIGVGLKHSF